MAQYYDVPESDPRWGQLIPDGYTQGPDGQLIPIAGSSGGTGAAAGGSSLSIGQVVGAQQAAGLQAAGYKLVQVGMDATGGTTYQITSAPNAFAPGTASAGVSQGTFSGSTTGSSAGQTTRSLTPEGEQSLTSLLGTLGRTSFGYTPAEIAAMQISPDQAHGIMTQAQQPIAGAADKASQQLQMAAAARGGYAPGLNATLENVQQTEGQQAGQAVENARTAIDAQNQQAAIAAAQARLNDQTTNTAQLSGLLTNFPESSTNSTGSSSSSSTGSSATSNASATGPSATQYLVPGGVATSGGGGSNSQVAIGPGGSAGSGSAVAPGLTAPALPGSPTAPTVAPTPTAAPPTLPKKAPNAFSTVGSFFGGY